MQLTGLPAVVSIGLGTIVIFTLGPEERSRRTGGESDLDCARGCRTGRGSGSMRTAQPLRAFAGLTLYKLKELAEFLYYLHKI